MEFNEAEVDIIGWAINGFYPVLHQSPIQFAKYLLTLVELAKKSQKEKIIYLELGIWDGGSIIFASQILKLMTGKPVRTIAIEPYTNPLSYLDYMTTNDAILIKGFSDSSEVKSILDGLRKDNFVCTFIDGNHLYEWAKKDYESLSPFSDCVAFHDCHQWNCKGLSHDLTVVKFWSNIKQKYDPSKVMEFFDPHPPYPRCNYRYVDKMGIGLLVNDNDVKTYNDIKKIWML